MYGPGGQVYVKHDNMSEDVSILTSNQLIFETGRWWSNWERKKSKQAVCLLKNVWCSNAQGNVAGNPKAKYWIFEEGQGSSLKDNPCQRYIRKRRRDLYRNTS